ncbi:MAG: hypothetical protein JST40_08990 [Armatimonadetes bacterium]|nr:hypothetical protein [Armatimonadota bacterium]
MSIGALTSLLTLGLALLSTRSLGDTVSTVDFASKPRPTNQMPFFSVGSDRAAIFLRDSHQRDLTALQKSLHFRYLRCHGIFNEEMEVVHRKPDGSLAYNWEKVDKFLHRLKAVGLRPFVEFGFMPEALASGKETVFWYRGNSTPPNSYKEWSDLVTEFIRHEISSFGLKEVRQWYFEIWNEPNLSYFWRGTLEEYFKLYETSARAVKAVDPKLRVGGPSTAGLGWIEPFLAYCSKNQVPIDFVSSHHYGATEGFVDPDGKGHTVLDTRPTALFADLAIARQEIRSSPYPKLPFYITEWGPSYSQVDPIHDNYICAAWILDKLTKSAPDVDGMSYWAFSDQFEEGGPQQDPFPGGFGLLNYDGLKKPGFFAYLFLAKLEKQTYATSDPRLIATRNDDRIALLAWDYTEPKITQPNNPFFHGDIKPESLGFKTIELRGLQPGIYHLQRTCTGYMRNDVYGTYLSLGKPKGDGASLPDPVLKKLREATDCRPERLHDIQVPADGRATVSLPMRTNDCWLVELERVRT